MALINLLRSPKVFLTLAFLVVLILIPFLFPITGILNILVFTFWGAFFAGSWHILGRYAGQISLAHSAFFTIGGYASTLLLLNYGLTPFLGMLVGGAIAAVLGVAIGLPSFRLRGLYFLLATLGFAEIMRVVLLRWKDVTGGPLGVRVPMGETSFYLFRFESVVPYYYIALVLMGVLMFCMYWMERSKLGFYLQAVRDDQEAAESLGIPVFKYKLIACAISCFFAALAGTFYIQYVCYMDPRDINIMRSIYPIIYSYIGGVSFLGPVIGSFVLTPLEQYLNIILGPTAPVIRHITFGIIMIVVLLFSPEGLEGKLASVWKRLVPKLRS